ncbi:MAG: glycosyltransferase, partial [Candidatus Eisenbacteria bacterium]|nr:glycosyltransferase [Candidatus Eisenbacteria bacterium]
GTRRQRQMCIRDSFFGGLLREETDRLLAACHVLVAPYHVDSWERASRGGPISSKILTYLASDRPVVVTPLSTNARIEERGFGSLAASDESADLARAIAAWAVRWRDDGAPEVDWPWPSPGPARRWIEAERTWDHAAADVEDVLRGIAGPAAPSGRAATSSAPRPR